MRYSLSNNLLYMLNCTSYNKIIRVLLIRLGQVGVRNQQNLYPRIPTADVAKLLQFSGSRVEQRDGFFFRERRVTVH